MALNSNKKIGELFEVAQLASLFVILIGLFFGSMFAFDSYFISIPVSFGIVILLYKLLEILINKRMERNRENVNMGASALWALFVVCAIPTNILIVHMFNVEFTEKQAIKDVGNNKIACLDSLHSKYTSTYETYLGQIKHDLLTYIDTKNYEKAVKIGLDKDDLNFWHKKSDLEIASFIDSFYISPSRNTFIVKDSVVFGSNFQTYIAEQRNNIQQFKHFQQNKTLNDLNFKLEKTRDSIVPFLKEKTKTDLIFNNICIDDNSLISSPLRLFRKQLGLSTLFILLLTNGLLLLPYFLSPKKVYGSTGGINNVKTYD